MGMFDSASSALDTASQMLAGGTNNPAAAASDADVKFWHGQNLDVDPDTESAGQAPNLENALNSYPVIEFIHFDIVHTSHSNFFTHDDYSDLKKNDKVQDGDRPRGIQFRSALEREAILLSTFMECTQTVLKERESNSSMGGVGAALNTLGSVLGASGGGSGQTKSSDVLPYVQKVVTAAKPILADSITYTNTHQAGCDFTQARANYRALLAKIATEKPQSDPAGGLMGQLPGIGSVAGTFGTMVSFTQGVAFKAPDVKARFFVLTALQQEPQIETACNQMTLTAISTLANPFLPVWFWSEPPKQDQWAGPDDPLSGMQGNMLSPATNLIDPTINQGRRDVQNAGNAVKGFFEHPPDDPPPGTEALGMAFNDPPKHKGDKSIVPMKMGDVACQAFITALGLTPPLGIPETVVSGVVGIVLEFMQGVYQALLVRDEKTVIDGAALLQSAVADIHIAKRLEALALDKLSFLQDAKKATTPSIGGFTVRPGDLADKGVGDLDNLVAEKISPLLDPILKYAMGDLATSLELGRQNGVNNTCHTMEWYLGRLPWVQATLFCNLFFPFWNALMRAVADLIGGPTGSVLKSIEDAADKMKGVVDSARDAIAKANAVQQAASDTASDFGSFDQSNVASKVGAAGSRFGQASKATAAKTTGPAIDQGLFTLPVTGRSEKGQGQNITQDEYSQVTTKWGDAHDIDDSDAPKNDAATAAGGSNDSATPAGGSAPAATSTNP